MSAGGSGFGRREVAIRCFAAEYDDASLEYSESDEERAPNYVVTPTGARVNRLFVVGVLTEVEPVSDDVLRARVVDPTGAFVVYAGQYQPEAKTALERAEPPAFVAVTGKARTFEPDDGDVVYTSVRPESINVVDADTRDRWTVQTAEQTVARVATFAAALEREERGAALTEALVESGVDPGLASGVPRAIAHYGTTAAYLAAVRDRAVQAAEVVAGERDEVEPLDVAPDEGGPVDVDLAGGVELAAPSSPAPAGEAGASASSPGDAGTGDAAAADASGTPASSEPTTAASEDAASDADEPGGAVASAEAEPTVAESSETESTPAAESAEPEPSATGDELGDFDDYGTSGGGGGEADETREVADAADAAEPTADETATGAETAGTDELYELDEAERQAVEEEFGTEFTTGNEVAEPGQADVATPGPDDASGSDAEAAGEAAGAAGEAGSAEPSTDEASADETETAEPPESSDQAAEADSATGDEDVDLVEAVVATMGDLDDGDGADREAVVEAVSSAHGVEEGTVEDAIQDALMGGRCYEPGDGLLKAI